MTKVCRHVIVFSLCAMAAHSVAARSRPAMPDRETLSASSPQALRQAGVAALRADNMDAAIGYFAEMVARQPRDGAGQTLLGLAYHLAGEKRPEAIDLALAGYDVAGRVEPGGFWAAALAGRAAYDQGRYDVALGHFSRALLLRPNDARVAAAVAGTAYLSGDSALAQVAAARAVSIEAKPAPGTLRLAAITAAANGDRAAAEIYLARLDDCDPVQSGPVRARIADLIQTAALDGARPDETVDASAGESLSPNQISLDVAIILSQNTHREHVGLNLLDGLGLQYGFSRQVTKTVQDVANTPVGDVYQRVLTSSITVPQLNYNLNLFNRGGQYYSVVARPQLTAYLNEESDFFVGRSIRVAVSGVQLGTLENIDIGIDMKVTPFEITAEGARVRISAERSFLTSDPAGNFKEALTLFRQRVSATAQIRFGETLMLSGLTENVEDRTFSKTPGLGEIPLFGLAFNERNKTQRRDSVMVLVTPARPTALPGRAFVRGDQAQRLAELWTKVVDPASNASVMAERLGRMHLFTRMTRSDAPMTFPEPREAASEVLAELIGI